VIDPITLEVVREERRFRTDNSVPGMLDEALYATAFEASPYHWPVIGWMKDLERITRDEMLDYFRIYYAPNNCNLLLVGAEALPRGGRIVLTAEVQLPPDVHVYAPGTQGYKPIALVMDPTPGIVLTPVNYPRAEVLYLPAIKERVPVFEGKFRLTQDLKISAAADFSSSLGTDGKAFTINGRLDYQACDKNICYLPASVPVHWQLQVLPLDRQRAPDDIRHK
jgi:hypothetical protein